MEAAAALARLVAAYETLTPASVARLGALYTQDAYFKDPFNEVRGVAAIEAIFAHMFGQVHAPHFVVHDRAVTGRDAFLTWELRFRAHAHDARERTIRGATHLRFAHDGRVEYHRDYWDPAEELYAKIPLLGALMRLLRRRLSAASAR